MQGGEKVEGTTTTFSRGNKRRKGPKDTPSENMPPDHRQRRAEGDEPSMAQLADPLMGALVNEGSLTKHHQVLISVAVENEIGKITEGVILEFRNSFVRWGPLWCGR